MHIVKIRRVGNSNVITLPREYESAGYTAGTSVVVELTAGGELVLLSEGRARTRIGEIGRRVVAEHREALDLLLAHDRGEAISRDGRLERRDEATMTAG